ncbi:MAG TPA: LUD domain-containing protein [Candidatus Saccharimonadales bacterium]|nr:LUD domain-containing protein [Candidatus Saccharimonadales bacterium]
MAEYIAIATDEAIETTRKALEANGFATTIVEDEDAARQAALTLIPKGSEVLTVSSKTIIDLGLDTVLNKSGDYDSVRTKLNAMAGDASKKDEQRKLGSAPNYVIGSVHALTQDGKALIASMSGSQLPAYTYGAGQVVWVVGAQKIVKNIAEAEARLRQHVFPLEDARALAVYGVNSSINKMLVYNKEFPGRVHVIIVKKALGF